MSNQTIPFEIHITTTDLPPNQVDLFIAVCIRNNGKPLLIELAQGQQIKQPMFSKIIPLTHLEEAIVKACEYAFFLQEEGFQSRRIKIEIPFLYAQKYEEYHAADGGRYYEWHGKIQLERINKLLELCSIHQVHLSHNAMKDENTIRFITLREYGSQEIFQQRIDNLIEALQQGNWLMMKQQSEYCLYDTNIVLDQGWLPNKQ